MYCSKCGEADQNANSYCRNCGGFRLDSIKKEMTILLVGNFVVLVACFSVLFIWILKKIYEAIEGRSIPNTNISYYLFFGPLIINLFSNLIFFVGVLRKIGKNSDNVHQTSEDAEKELKNSETNNLLPSADFQGIIPSVTEETTKDFEIVSHK